MRNIRCFIWRVAAAAVAVSYLIVRALSMHVDQSSTHFVAQIFHLHNHGLYLATDYNSTSWISNDALKIGTMENCIQWWFIDPICGLVFSFASSHSQIMSLFFYLFCCCCCSKAAWNDIHQAISSNWWSIRCIECEWCSKFQRQRRRAKQSKKKPCILKEPSVHKDEAHIFRLC